MEVKLKNIDFSYKKVNYYENKIFENISVTFKKNKISSVIGTNGCGKSTLLNIIALNFFSTKGTIDFNNYHISTRNKTNYIDDVQNKIGYLPQEDEFVADTVYEELEYSLASHNYQTKNIKKRMIDSLIMAYLNPEILQYKIKDLSKSQKRKLSLAKILIFNPELYILDDPTKYLDSKTSNELIKLIRMLKKRYNKTIIVASNNIDLIYKISEEIVVIKDRKIKKYTKDEYTKNINELKKEKLTLPRTINFSNMVLENKNIKIGYRDEINDLIKDIYRFVK